MMAECNQAESSTRLVMMISLALSFFFLACAVGALGIVFIMGVKLRNMERNIIEVLQKIQAERVTSRNIAILSLKAESAASSEHHSYSNVDVNIERVTSSTSILNPKAESAASSEHHSYSNVDVNNERVSSRNTSILNSTAESGASSKHDSYSNVDLNKEASNVHAQVMILADVEATSWLNQSKMHSEIDDYVIPNLDVVVSTDVQPRQKLISVAADTSMPTLCARGESKAQADGAAFEMDINMAYEQHMHNRQ